MKKIIGIILIIVALLLGYTGITGLQESSGSVKFLGIKISATDKNAKETAYVELAGAVIALAGGMYLVGSRKK